MSITLADILKIKEERGYSVAKLSEYSGVPVGTLQKLLRGDTANPRKATLEALEKVLYGDEDLYPGKAYQYKIDSTHPGILGEARIYGTERIFIEEGEHTLQDYYALPDEHRVELIDGFFYDMASPSTLHQQIAGYVYARIANYIDENGGNCLPFIAPADVQLNRDNKNMIQPDVFIICDRKKVKRFGIYGAPDFVLEILSKSTRKRDLTTKLMKYMEAGVKEYWVIDPEKRVLVVYLQEEDGMPRVCPLQGMAGLHLYEGRLQIDLGRIDGMIDRYAELEGEEED